MPTKKLIKSVKKVVVLKSVESTSTHLFKRIIKRAIKNNADKQHRSFRRSDRVDYVRTLKMPGYIAFTKSVKVLLWNNRKMFILLAVVYSILTGLLVGMASQDNYTIISQGLRQSGSDIAAGNVGGFGDAVGLLTTAITGGLNDSLSTTQQLYAGVIGLMAWLTVVWLLRNILAGHNVKLRDGLYNSGAPILSTFVIALVFIAQLLPLALAFIGYAAASSSGLLAGGIETMLFWAAAGLLGLLSLYLVTSTFFAMVIVTLPGMYPYRALKTARDIVLGRRVRILMRMLWLGLVTLIAWVVIMIPIVLFDTWIKGLFPAISGIPVVPAVLLFVSALTIIWVAAYIYLLYRRVVADDSNAA
jgi:hypothetical protein